MALKFKGFFLYSISLVVGLSLIFGLSSCGATPVDNQPGFKGELPLKAPSKIGAGEGFEAVAGPVQIADGTSLNLVALGSYGPRLYQAVFNKGLAHFSIPGEDTRGSGQLNLVINLGLARTEATVNIEPGQAVEPVKPLVGSRSIPADQQHWSMVVVIPGDKYGNPVAEDTAVDLKVLHPANNLEQKKIAVKNLLAWARIYSGTKAGQTVVTTGAGDKAGPEDVLTEFAGLPVSFSLTAEPPTLPADGRALLKLGTSILKDKYDNVLPDGTLVTFEIQESGNEQMRYLPAYSIGGVAQTPLQAPDQPGIMQVKARVAGVESSPLQITFTPGPAAGDFPIVVLVNKVNGAVSLEAGPLLGQLGQFVPDGTPVLFNISGSDGKTTTFKILAKNGRAGLGLAGKNLTPGNYTVQATVGSGEGRVTFTIPPQ